MPESRKYVVVIRGTKLRPRMQQVLMANKVTYTSNSDLILKDDEETVGFFPHGMYVHCYDYNAQPERLKKQKPQSNTVAQQVPDDEPLD